jgi:hypothetical protein
VNLDQGFARAADSRANEAIASEVVNVPMRRGWTRTRNMHLTVRGMPSRPSFLRAVEAAHQSLAAMHVGFFVIFDCLDAGQ